MLDYGIVGNCKTCALISKNASVNWMCYPTFSSPSIFAKLLDEKNGGSFEIVPDKKCSISQEYIKNTNILETTFSCKKYSFKVVDFIPRYRKILPNKRKSIFKRNELIRLIIPIRGVPKIKVICDVKLDYARGTTEVMPEQNTIVYKKDDFCMQLFSSVSNEFLLNNAFFDVTHKFYLVLKEKDEFSNYNMKKCLGLFSSTKRYWIKWVNSLTLPEKNKDVIIRSALVLKLLTFSESGAIIAAATTSVPEEAKTQRCWDYRYCWIRDAAHCADALNKIGRRHEAKNLMNFFITHALEDDHIQIMYGIHGETRIKEETLDNLSGYMDSRPVRIGNAAYNQTQNDIYGELIDIMYLYFVYYEFESKMKEKYWRFLRFLVNQIKFEWEKKDSGIWEFREIFDHYTFSKFMCYVGVDRAIKIALHFKKDAQANEWVKLKEEIRQDLLSKGYNETLGSFTMEYNGSNLDASLLLMTYHEFLSGTDPRIISTVKKIYEKLAFDGLVKRYDKKDDFGSSKSAFTVCTFWLIQALFYIGETKKAEAIFKKIIKNGNHLGLFSEDIDLQTKKQFGNFPQAYVHISIINTAILLSEWSTKRKKIDWKVIYKKEIF
jgi:alpha,alpha-trehalase